jgi:hypothetical protein
MPRGGARLGAGRKAHSLSLVVERSTAASILDKINDGDAWLECYDLAKEQGDVRAMTDILKYLTDRRDGKAAQSIHLTEHSDRVATEELARAQAIIAEIRDGQAQPTPVLPAADAAH